VISQSRQRRLTLVGEINRRCRDCDGCAALPALKTPGYAHTVAAATGELMLKNFAETFA